MNELIDDKYIILYEFVLKTILLNQLRKNNDVEEEHQD